MVQEQVEQNFSRSVAIKIVAGMLLCTGVFGFAIQRAGAQPGKKNLEFEKVSAKRSPANSFPLADRKKVLREQKKIGPRISGKTPVQSVSTADAVKSNEKSNIKDKVPYEKDTNEKDINEKDIEGKDSGDGESTVAEVSVAKDVSGVSQFEVIAEEASDFHYVGSEKSDPFLPPLITTSDGSKSLTLGAVLGSQPGGIEIPIVSPLQQFDLIQLSVVGVWQLATGERKAMILSPPTNGGSGQGIIVKTGDPVGNRGGKITSIGEEFVNVREFMLAPDGSRRYLDQKMQMGKKEEVDIPRKIRFTPGAARTSVVTENQNNFEKIMDEERKKNNPDTANPERDQQLNGVANAPLNQAGQVPQPKGATELPAAADKKGALDLVKKMPMDAEVAKAGTEGQSAGQPNVQATDTDKPTTAYRDFQAERPAESAPKLERQDNAPTDAANTVRKVF